MSKKTILSRRTKYQIRTAVLIVSLGIICFALPGISSEKDSEKDSNYNLSENFQAALDAFKKQYGFPGATAAYVLRDGTVGTGYLDANNPFGFPQKTTTADGIMAWHPGTAQAYATTLTMAYLSLFRLIQISV